MRFLFPRNGFSFFVMSDHLFLSQAYMIMFCCLPRFAAEGHSPRDEPALPFSPGFGARHRRCPDRPGHVAAGLFFRDSLLHVDLPLGLPAGVRAGLPDRFLHDIADRLHLSAAESPVPYVDRRPLLQSVSVAAAFSRPEGHLFLSIGGRRFRRTSRWPWRAV